MNTDNNINPNEGVSTPSVEAPVATTSEVPASTTATPSPTSVEAVDQDVGEQPIQSVVREQPQISTPIDPFNPMPVSAPSDGNNGGSNKKIFIIIGVVVLIVVVVVLIVMSNTGDSSSKKTSSSGKNKQNQTSVEDKTITIYYYLVKSEGTEFKMVRYTEALKTEELEYEELYRYECKDRCLSHVASDYLKNNETLYIYDEDKIYIFDEEANKLNELSFDKEINGKDFILKISDEYIAAYNNETLTVDTDEINMHTVKETKVNGTKVMISEVIYTNRDILKEKLYVVLDDYTEYKIYKFYQDNASFAELKEKDGTNFFNVTYDGSFVILDGSSANHIVVSLNGKVQISTKKEYYAVNNSKLVLATDKGNVEIYDTNGLVSTIEADASRVAGKGYAALIKDNKLVLYDCINDKEIYNFGQLAETERFFEEEKIASINYSESGDSYQRISIFVVDTSKEEQDKKLFGRYFEYNFITNEGTINDNYSYTVY